MLLNMICFPNCKINIGLYVTGKRPDGYHNIETIFYPLPLCDILEIISARRNEFTTSGIDIPGIKEANLCLKTYDILKKEFNIPPVKMHLHKKIPTGAGLGGGSSNATYTVKLLNELFSLNLSKDKIQKIASDIGSDCPFFIENKPVFATNKGDVFAEIKIDLSNCYIIVVKPPVHISTQEAYSLIKPLKAVFPLSEINSIKIDEWKNHISNDFEKPVIEKYPEIKMIKDKLYNSGAVYSSMSGSGSSVYGIFYSPVDFKDEFKNCFIWKGKLR